MTITQQHAETVARSVVAAYERMQDDPGERSDRRVSEALWRATIEAMHRVAQAAAADEVLVDVKPSFSYKAAINVTATVTLLVATDRRLWVARHDDGFAQDPVDVAYEAVRPVGKLLSASVKVEHEPGGVIITGSRSLAEWLQSLQLQRPAHTAPWLTAASAVGGSSGPAQTPAGWHPDPTGRHQLRYWNGSAWSEHVSDNGVQSTDAVS